MFTHKSLQALSHNFVFSDWRRPLLVGLANCPLPAVEYYGRIKSAKEYQLKAQQIKEGLDQVDALRAAVDSFQSSPVSSEPGLIKLTEQDQATGWALFQKVDRLLTHLVNPSTPIDDGLLMDLPPLYSSLRAHELGGYYAVGGSDSVDISPGYLMLYYAALSANNVWYKYFESHSYDHKPKNTGPNLFSRCGNMSRARADDTRRIDLQSVIDLGGDLPEIVSIFRTPVRSTPTENASAYAWRSLESGHATALDLLKETLENLYPQTIQRLLSLCLQDPPHVLASEIKSSLKAAIRLQVFAWDNEQARSGDDDKGVKGDSNKKNLRNRYENVLMNFTENRNVFGNSRQLYLDRPQQALLDELVCSAAAEDEKPLILHYLRAGAYDERLLSLYRQFLPSQNPWVIFRFVSWLKLCEKAPGVTAEQLASMYECLALISFDKLVAAAEKEKGLTPVIGTMALLDLAEMESPETASVKQEAVTKLRSLKTSSLPGVFYGAHIEDIDSYFERMLLIRNPNFERDLFRFFEKDLIVSSWVLRFLKDNPKLVAEEVSTLDLKWLKRNNVLTIELHKVYLDALFALASYNEGIRDWIKSRSIEWDNLLHDSSTLISNLCAWGGKPRQDLEDYLKHHDNSALSRIMQMAQRGEGPTLASGKDTLLEDLPDTIEWSRDLLKDLDLKPFLGKPLSSHQLWFLKSLAYLAGIGFHNADEALKTITFEPSFVADVLKEKPGELRTVLRILRKHQPHKMESWDRIERNIPADAKTEKFDIPNLPKIDRRLAEALKLLGISEEEFPLVFQKGAGALKKFFVKKADASHSDKVGGTIATGDLTDTDRAFIAYKAAYDHIREACGWK